jgi:endonuclease/exonuclease/phosphatase (EEP) superfamily protein YafD
VPAAQGAIPSSTSLRNPRRTLSRADEWGLPLCASEIHALIQATPAVWESVVEEVDASQLREVLADESRQGADRVVIAGDFNNAVAFQSFMFAGLAPAGFVDALGSAPRETSTNHRHPIDWLFVKGVARSTGRVERVADASDHYPLIATIVR